MKAEKDESSRKLREESKMIGDIHLEGLGARSRNADASSFNDVASCKKGKKTEQTRHTYLPMPTDIRC